MEYQNMMQKVIIRLKLSLIQVDNHVDDHRIFRRSQLTFTVLFSLKSGTLTQKVIPSSIL